MLIPCPICGLRDQSEFTYGGDATPVRPNMISTEVERWAAYVYDRSNPRGGHEELWHHVHGCRSWLFVERNTETHDVFSARLLGPWAGKDNG
jgi:sarcosine oxidase subunit delta